MGARAAPDDAGDKEQEGGALQQSSLFAQSSSKSQWRGSQVVLRSAVSAITLNPSAELTYNPYFAFNWSFQPWFWFNDKAYLRAQLDVIHELTEADTTTYQGEAVVDDLRLVVGGSPIWTIPYVGINFSANLVLTLPTSKASQARTLFVALGPGLRLSRGFDVLGGLVVGYNLRVTGRLYQFTTAEYETPLIPGCSSGPSGCSPYLNTGVRNPYMRVSQVADISLKVLDWVGVSLAVGHSIDWLHDLAEADSVSFQAVEDQDRRYLTFMELALSFSPIDFLEVGIGYSALHPQLAPDSTYYTPFFNRYSVLFVDLKIHADSLASRIRRIWQ